MPARVAITVRDVALGYITMCVGPALEVCFNNFSRQGGKERHEGILLIAPSLRRCRGQCDPDHAEIFNRYENKK